MNHCIQWWSLSVPPVPPQQLLLLAETLKSRLLSQPLSSHTCHSLAEVFPGCNCFYLRVDKNYPALGVHEAGAGKGFFCVFLKEIFSSPLKTQKNGNVSFLCAMIGVSLLQELLGVLSGIFRCFSSMGSVFHRAGGCGWSGFWNPYLNVSYIFFGICKIDFLI